MARYTGPVCRLCRREKMKLFLKGPSATRPSARSSAGRTRPVSMAVTGLARALST